MESGREGPIPSPQIWRIPNPNPNPNPSFSYIRPPPRTSSSSSRERLVAIVLALVAILSPLFIDRRPAADAEDEDSQLVVAIWLPLLLLLGLVTAITASLCLDRSLTKFDPNWIHRVGGSPGGIIVILIILALVLKCKAEGSCWEA